MNSETLHLLCNAKAKTDHYRAFWLKLLGYKSNKFCNLDFRIFPVLQRCDNSGNYWIIQTRTLSFTVYLNISFFKGWFPFAWEIVSSVNLSCSIYPSFTPFSVFHSLLFHYDSCQAISASKCSFHLHSACLSVCQFTVCSFLLLSVLDTNLWHSDLLFCWGDDAY